MDIKQAAKLLLYSEKKIRPFKTYYLQEGKESFMLSKYYDPIQETEYVRMYKCELIDEIDVEECNE